jgi:hypothetical protein
MNSTRLSAVFVVAVLLSVIHAVAQVTGGGTKGTIPVWTGPTSLGDSVIVQKSGSVAIGAPKPFARVYVESSGKTLPAVIGYNTSNTGTAAGGIFQTKSPSATALIGAAIATTGTADGIYGTTASGGGSGVFGNNTATSGFGNGVLGTSNAAGPGVNGTSLTTTGFSMGFYGATSSPGAVVALLRSHDPAGNVIIGQVGPDESAVNVFRVDGTGKGFFDGGTQTGGADFAESVAIAGAKSHYEPGDLMMVDASANRQLTLAAQPYSTLVAGIYSTKPGVLATTRNTDDAGLQAEVPLAVVGIVPCKASAENGPIERGDLLVTSSTPGHAMKGTDRNRMLGAVVGKALEPLREGKGVIQVLVTLQ